METEQLQQALKGYHDLIDYGRRETDRIEISPNKRKAVDCPVAESHPSPGAVRWDTHRRDEENPAHETPAFCRKPAAGIQFLCWIGPSEGSENRAYHCSRVAF